MCLIFNGNSEYYLPSSGFLSCFDVGLFGGNVLPSNEIICFNIATKHHLFLITVIN